MERKWKMRILLAVLFFSIIFTWGYVPSGMPLAIIRVFILLGMLIALAFTMEGRSYEKYSFDSSKTWLLIGIVLFVLSMVLLLASIGAMRMGYENGWIAWMVMGLPVMVGGYMSVRKSKRRGKLDRLIRRPYKCPICGTRTDRLSRACYGCGAVLWSVPIGRSASFPYDESILTR